MPATMWPILVALILATNHEAIADSDDLVTCQGNIRSSVPIPYQKIKVKLLTRSGNTKADYDCAPNSGYFVIPLYDKGQFKLRADGPPGWTFDPPEVDLNLDGSKENVCSKGEDVDFTFKGFSIMGKVVSAGSADGPEGVPIALVEAGSRRTVLTQKGGNFAFPAVMPGTYRLEFRSQTTEVKVTNDNVAVSTATTFVIEGYTVQGTVRWKDSRPTSAWAVLAVKGAADDAAAGAICCGRQGALSRQLPKVAGFSLPAGHRVACVASADLGNGGAFEFPCVKSASASFGYALVPVAMTKSGQAMDIRPESVPVELTHGDLRVDPFEVAGFPVDGQVEEAGEAVEVRVEETGFETVTDAAGRFRLNGMRPGQYTLVLKKRGVQFDPKKVQIDVDRVVLPAMRPDRFEVCGEAVVADSVEMHFLRQSSSGADALTKVFSDVSSGRFCAMLARGAYVLRPMGRVRLSPAEVSFNVPASSGQRFLFSQFQAIVSGQVSCLGGVCAGVRVELLSGAVSVQKQTAVSTGAFRFEGVDPGTYEVCVSHASLCFEKDCQGITVIDKNVEDVRFTQKGFLLRLDSSHSTELKIAGRVLQVKAGLSTHCVVEQKPTPLTVVGCHRFAKSSTLMFKPKSEETIKLVAEAHRLKVNVQTKIAVKDLKLTAKAGGEQQTMDFKQEPTTSSDSPAASFRYSGELFFPAGKELVLEPSSASLVFRPSQTIVRMPNDCHSVDLQGKTGIFIQGSIKPAIAGVEIVVTPEGAALPSDAVRVMTDANGKYRAGPLESTRFSIEGFKEGYSFERVGTTNDLSGIKFSRVDIVVLQKDTKTPLVGAVVSVTGGPDYRNNSRTGPKGELSLIKLAPGSYYIRVMMKEYKFEPVSEMIEVTENSEKRVEIFGKKVAYSLMGKVTSITGEAEPDVELEATSEGCDRHEEDATTDENGHFRIRGLRENCDYRLQLRRADPTAGDRPKFERTLPAVREVRIGREDQTIDVVVVRPQNGTQVSVSVQADAGILPALRVLVSREGRQLHSLPAAPFVVVPGEFPCDGRELAFELQHSSGLRLGDGEAGVQAIVRADRAYRHVELRSTATPASLSGEAGSLENGGTPPAPFVAVFSVFVALAIVFRNDLAEFLHRRHQESPNAGGDRRGKNKTR